MAEILQNLHLNKGDILLIRTPHTLSKGGVDHLKNSIGEMFKAVDRTPPPIIVLHEGLEVGVLSVT